MTLAMTASADRYRRFHGYPGWHSLRNVSSGRCLVSAGGNDEARHIRFDCASQVDQA
ncbi:hypothetical protein [Lentzea sp. CC55]|uniref:hypothetical protein n=1 Tax=Lentzea sp. CC55 TaxID=2884909 RepID=UPI001F2032CC|nr:hypothetical protein [Lentzea sp. CC55]MCG8926072.1 hypothetical protein [Lentzea sp. CC55]